MAMGTRMSLSIGALLVAGAGVPFANAEIPKGGVITACYTKSGGALRVIDPAATGCKQGETQLSWGVQGPSGPAGPTGPTGATGATGSVGPAGPGLDLANAYVRNSPNVRVKATFSGSATAECDPGDVAIAGWNGANGVNFLVYFQGILTTPEKIGSATDVASYYNLYVYNNNPAGGPDILIFSTVTCAPPV